jgi:hypothetical protein
MERNKEYSFSFFFRSSFLLKRKVFFFSFFVVDSFLYSFSFIIKEKKGENEMNTLTYHKTCPKLTGDLLIFIDGKNIQSYSDYLDCIWKQLEFPEEQHNWDAYLDWMRDLSWLKEKKISIIITNFKSFLNKEKDGIKTFVLDFETVIFPFWNKDAIFVLKNESLVKEISVCCILEQDIKQQNISTEDIKSNIQQNALLGQKTPHFISRPVLRMHEGILCLASFVIFYNKEQLQSMMLKRPSVWVVADIKTGEILQRYNCQENDFSDGSYQAFYNASLKQDGRIDYIYRNSYALMDIIRNEYIKNNALRIDLYQKYLEQIHEMTSNDIWKFYQDLSKIV